MTVVEIVFKFCYGLEKQKYFEIDILVYKSF